MMHHRQAGGGTNREAGFVCSATEVRCQRSGIVGPPILAPARTRRSALVKAVTEE